MVIITQTDFQKLHEDTFNQIKTSIDEGYMSFGGINVTGGVCHLLWIEEKMKQWRRIYDSMEVIKMCNK